MAEILIQVNDRRKQYTASGGQTVFPYDFPIFADTQIKVFRSTGLASTLLTLNLDYAVSGVGAEGGGDVVLAAGAAAGDVYTLLGDAPYSRTSDFVEAGDFFAQTLNRELDLLQMQIQQLATKLMRAARLPDDDPDGGWDAVPALAERLGKIAGWDAAGRWIAIASFLGSGTPTTSFTEALLSLASAAAVRQHLLLDKKGADIASAASIDLDAATGDLVDLTGTATVTAITLAEGVEKTVRLAGAASFTHGASLVLPGGSLKGQAGDVLVFRGYAAGVVRCVAYQPIAGRPGLSGARGIDCRNNSSTPNTQFDLDADAVALRNAGDQIAVVYNPGAPLTCNVATAGPAANGRDQAGAFSAGSWVHFYWIWNGSTLATLASATAPPAGPTLPTGYTHWAYAGAVRFNGSSQLIPTYIKGDKAFYRTPQAILSTTSLSTSETDLQAALRVAVPPNAVDFDLQHILSVGAGAGGGVNLRSNLRLVSGVDSVALPLTAIASNAGVEGTNHTLPMLDSLFCVHTNNTNVSTALLELHVCAYRLPTGGT